MERFFPTLSALAEHVAKLPRGQETRDDFAGGSSDDAIRLATRGWPEGARLATELATKVADRIIEQTVLTSEDSFPPSYDVIGAAYDAGAVALGIPEAWGVTQPREAKKGVRIVVNPWVSAGVPNENIQRRGLAITALALALEARGYPVTVDIFYHFSDSETYLIRVADAASGSMLDLDRLVYALAHPTMIRKLIRLTVNGRRADYSGDRWGDHGGFTHQDARPTGAIDLFIGGMHLFSGERWKDERWVLAEYERQTTREGA